MTCTECVVLGFVSSQEARDSTVLFDRVKLVLPAGENFVGVSLMTDIPNQFVCGSVEDIMHRHRQFDRTETSAGVTTDSRAGLNDELSHLVRNFLKVFHLQLPEIGWRIYLSQESHVFTFPVLL